MVFIPEWAPNIHPMIVHFPIALLIGAIIFDFLALIWRKQLWLRYGSTTLFILGTLFLIATYFSGKQAADSVTIPTYANTVITDHADWALRTLWFFIIYSVIRFLFTWLGWDRRTLYGVSLFVVGVVGSFFIFQTAERGAQLVYQHGVGVLAVQQAKEKLPETIGESTEGAISGIISQADGSWFWRSTPNSIPTFLSDFQILEGVKDSVRVSKRSDPQQGEVLALQVSETPVAFLGGQKIASVEAEVVLNLDEFQGNVYLIHHWQNEKNYRFVSVGKGVVRSGRFVDGKVDVMDEEAFQGMGWLTIKAVGDGSHFRGYVNDKLYVHGHGEELSPGLVGLRLEGNGTVLMKQFSVKNLRPGTTVKQEEHLMNAKEKSDDKSGNH